MLVKEGKELVIESQHNGWKTFCTFLGNQVLNGRKVVLVTHNGNKFGYHRLLNALKRHDLLDQFIGLNVLLLDSLKVISQEIKRNDSYIKSCRNKSLSALFECLMEETFEAHDAEEDDKALAKILFSSPLQLSRDDLVSNSVSSTEFVRDLQTAQEAKARKSTLQGLPISDGMKEKLRKAGLDKNTLTHIFQDGEAKGLLSVLALCERHDQIGGRHAEQERQRTSKSLLK